MNSVHISQIITVQKYCQIILILKITVFELTNLSFNAKDVLREILKLNIHKANDPLVVPTLIIKNVHHSFVIYCKNYLLYFL